MPSQAMPTRHPAFTNSPAAVRPPLSVFFCSFVQVKFYAPPWSEGLEEDYLEQIDADNVKNLTNTLSQNRLNSDGDVALIGYHRGVIINENCAPPQWSEFSGTIPIDASSPYTPKRGAPPPKTPVRTAPPPAAASGGAAGAGGGDGSSGGGDTFDQIMLLAARRAAGDTVGGRGAKSVNVRVEGG